MTTQSTHPLADAAAGAAANETGVASDAARSTAEPGHGAELMVPLNRLKASPNNARKVRHTEASIEALAASIEAKGVLQAPVVEIERDGEGVATGAYLVTIGEGRRQALRLLAKRKAIKRTHPVKVVVDTENDAHEISLDENVTREAMHPADQYEAFKRLADERGYGAEEIAARFGVSAETVRKRLRMGAAAPELLAAYRAGEVALDQLMAFCVSEDADRQRQVLAQIGPHTPAYVIRRAMTEAKVRADDRRAVFVGLEAYAAAGGSVLRDLFSEDGEGWLENPALLDRLVAEKLAALAEETREREGWKWAEISGDYGEVYAMDRVYPVETIRSEAEAAEIAVLAEAYDRIVAEAGEDGLSSEDDARLEEIDRALQAFGPDFDYAPEARARGGVMVLLGHDGAPRFERGLVRAEDVPAVEPPPWDEATSEGASGGSTAGAGDGREPGEDAAGRDFGASEFETEPASNALSERLLIDLTAHRTMGLRDAVQADADMALAVVVHALALQVFHPGHGSWTPLQMRLTVNGLERLAPGVSDGPAGRRVTDRLETWGLRLPERPEALWEAIAALGRVERLDLLACCVGLGVHAVRDPHDRRTEAWAQAEVLATTTGLDMSETWTATSEGYFSRVPKARILEAVTEAAGPEEAERMAAFKKSDMAEAAERLLEGRRWLPEVLRTASAVDDAKALEADPSEAIPLAAE